MLIPSTKPTCSRALRHVWTQGLARIACVQHGQGLQAVSSSPCPWDFLMTGNHTLGFGCLVLFGAIGCSRVGFAGPCWLQLLSATNLLPIVCFSSSGGKLCWLPISWEASRGIGFGMCFHLGIRCRLSADMLPVLWSGQSMGQKLHLAQHYCWGWCPRSSVWGMVPFRDDVGCSFSP